MKLGERVTELAHRIDRKVGWYRLPTFAPWQRMPARRPAAAPAETVAAS